ncbi:hypothetical protein E2C01_065134 [Portunus trituberculatus]|uniref:Uncharacterized protein n=1 Tax=Portunus trituberculatus TaxID=210409 RepID=A0A5B7HDP4_PORTR|nr:hypothetical protein [Portunus trituberculatus]
MESCQVVATVLPGNGFRWLGTSVVLHHDHHHHHQGLVCGRCGGLGARWATSVHLHFGSCRSCPKADLASVERSSAAVSLEVILLQ